MDLSSIDGWVRAVLLLFATVGTAAGLVGVWIPNNTIRRARTLGDILIGAFLLFGVIWLVITAIRQMIQTTGDFVVVLQTLGITPASWSIVGIGLTLWALAVLGLLASWVFTRDK